MTWQTVSLMIMALFYVVAGVNHFYSPEFYLRIMPSYIPQAYHPWLNWVSGAAEIVLGVGLLIPPVSQLSAWGIILLLIAVFPANIYHYQAAGAGMNIPQWLLLARLPVQFLLLYWAYLHT